MDWDAGELTGPDGEDWRFSFRCRHLAMLSRPASADGSVLIDDPVELYFSAGVRVRCS